jgi:hypothetical protein
VDAWPFTLHLVRDIGVADVVAAATVIWFAKQPVARSAVQAGASFLVLHAAVHLWDAATGREHAHQLLVDVPQRLFAAGSGAVDRLVTFAPRHTAKEGEER